MKNFKKDLTLIKEELEKLKLNAVDKKDFSEIVNKINELEKATLINEKDILTIKDNLEELKKQNSTISSNVEKLVDSVNKIDKTVTTTAKTNSNLVKFWGFALTISSIFASFIFYNFSRVDNDIKEIKDERSNQQAIKKQNDQ